MVTFSSVLQKKKPEVDAGKIAVRNEELTIIIDEKQKEIDQKNALIEAKDKEIAAQKKLIEKYESSDSSLTETKKNLEKAQADLKTLEEERDELLSQLETAKNELEAVKKDLNKAQEDAKVAQAQLEAEKAERAKEVEGFRNQIEEIKKNSSKKVELLNETITEKVNALENAAEKLSEYKTQIEELRIANQTLQQSIDTMSANGNEIDAEVEKLKTALGVSESAKQELENDYNTLKAQKETMEEQINGYLDAVKKAGEKLDKSKADYEETASQLATKEYQLEIANKALNKFTQKAEKATIHVKEKVKLIKNLTDEIEELKSKNADLQEKLEESEVEISDLKQGISVISDKLNEAETTIISLNQEISAYQEQLKANEEINQEKLKKSQEELNEQVEKVAALKKELATKNGELGRVKGNLTNSVKAREARDVKIRELNNDIKALKNRISTLETAITVNEEIYNEVVEANNKLIQENEELKQLNKDLQTGLDIERARVEEAESAKEELQATLMATNEELENLRGDFQSLKTAFEEKQLALVKNQGEKDIILTQINCLYIAITAQNDGDSKTVEEKFDAIEAKFDELKESLNSANDKMLENTNSSFNEIQELKGQISESKEELDRVKAHLETVRTGDKAVKTKLKAHARTLEVKNEKLTEQKAQAEADAQAAKDAKTQAEADAQVAKEAQIQAEADAKNARIYDRVKFAILKEFDEHYDSYIIINKNEEQNVDKASWGLYRAVNKAKKVSNKNADAENGYIKIVENIVSKYDDILSKASDERKEEFSKNLGEHIAITESKRAVEKIIAQNSSKVKGTLKKLGGTALALAAVVIVSVGANFYQGSRINTQAGEIKAQEVIIDQNTKDSYKNMMESKKKDFLKDYKVVTEKHEEAIELKKDQGEEYFANNSILSTNFNDLTSVVESANLIYNSNAKTSSDFFNAYNNYTSAVENNDQASMILYETAINGYLDSMNNYASNATTYYNNMIAEINKKLSEYQVIELKDLDTNSQAYNTFRTLFGGALQGTGTIEIKSFIYQGSSGKVNITYDKYDHLGNKVESSCNQSYEIDINLVNGDMVLGALNEVLNNSTQIEDEVEP